MWENVPVIVLFTFLFGGTAITKMWNSWNETRLELARIKAQQQPVSGADSRTVEALRAELETMRSQLNALRDTSTQYDMSFDTALQRVENRVSHIERKIGAHAGTEQPETITLTGR